MNLVFFWKRFVVIALVLWLHGVAGAQTLYDVVSSLTERHQMVAQRQQVKVQLRNNHNGDAEDVELPDYEPIEWKSFSSANTPQVNSASWSQRIGVLNQAVDEFEKLKGYYLNVKPDDLDNANLIIGALRPFYDDDFAPLPRVSVGNFHAVLQELAWRVRRLRVLSWPVAFETFEAANPIGKEEYVSEWNDGVPTIEERVPDGYNGTTSWTPEVTSVCSVPEDSDPSWIVNDSFTEGVSVGGRSTITKEHSGEGDDEVSYELHSVRLETSQLFASSVDAIVTSAANDQISGEIALLSRSRWSIVTGVTAPGEYNRNQGGYKVIDPSSLSANVPNITVAGKWHKTSGDDEVEVFEFVPTGYQYIITKPVEYEKAYEQNSAIAARTLYAVCIPEFDSGVDAPSLVSMIAQSLVVAHSRGASNGDILVHPLPSLLYGIDMGPGLKGVGNGLVGVRFKQVTGLNVTSFASNYRVDEATRLCFAGNTEDFHVVYTSSRSARTQSLPDFGREVTINDETLHDTVTLFNSWELPRLRQVVSRDLVVDVTYSSSHYGYVIKVYRRLFGQDEDELEPGTVVPVAGLPLLKTWTAENSSPEDPHPTAPENLKIESSGATFQLLDSANHKTMTLSLESEGNEKYKEKIIRNNLGTILEIHIDGVPHSSTVYDSYDSIVSTKFPTSKVTTIGDKTVEQTATVNKDDPGTQNGRYPSTLHVEYEGVQDEVDYTWNTDGVLTKFTQGSWETEAVPAGNLYSSTHKFGNTAYSRSWVEAFDQGSRVRFYSAPNGNVTSRGADTCDWSEMVYGDEANGLPNLPALVRTKADTGKTFQYTVNGLAYNIETVAGKLTGDSVTRGVRDTMSVNKRGYTTLHWTYDIASNLQIGGATASNFTSWGAPTRSTDYTTGLASNWSYEGNLTYVSSISNALGLSTALSEYDVFGRPTKTESNGITAETTFGAFNTTVDVTGSVTGQLSQTRDAFGRVTASTHEWNDVTESLSIAHNPANRQIQYTDILGTHNATIRNNDGSLETATGVTQAFGGDTGSGISIDQEEGAYKGLFKSVVSETNTPNNQTTTWTDAWGRIRRIEAPLSSGTGTTMAFTDIEYSLPNTTLQKTRVSHSDGRKTLTESDPYHAAGATTRSGIDANNDGLLSTGDRFVESTTSVTSGQISTIVKMTDNTEVGGLREILRTQWNPADGKTETSVNGTEETISHTPNYPAKSQKTTSSRGWESNSQYNSLGLTTGSSLTYPGMVDSQLTPQWRADGSLAGISYSAGNETHSAGFNPNGTLSSFKVPRKDEILGTHVIAGGNETLTLDGITRVTKLDGTQSSISGSQINGHTAEIKKDGDNSYKKVITPAAGAPTDIDYNLAGAPLEKTYNSTPNGTTYGGDSHSYLNGLLHTTTNPRGGVRTLNYTTDGARDIDAAVWSAQNSGVFTIPALAEGYHTDLGGRTDAIIDASGTRSITYGKGHYLSTSYTGGFLKGYQFSLGRDQQLGHALGFELKRDGANIHQASYIPENNTGRLHSLTSGAITIEPQRDAHGRIIGHKYGSSVGDFTALVTQSWQRGIAGRIESATNNVPGAAQFTYLHATEAESFDAYNRRLKCTTTDGTWTYGYTNGQLTHATHTAHGTFTYHFDAAGRRSPSIGTSTNANNSQLLNQTVVWNHSQNKTLTITAHPDARLFYNGSEIPDSDFNGSYQVTLTPPNNSPQGGWVAWNTLAILEGQGEAGASPDAKSAQQGAVWIPPAQETLSYDASGNRQGNAQWDYGWDGKDQLVRARTKNLTASPHGYDITFSYDAEGRRVKKHTLTYQNGQPVAETIITFVWDGWDLLYERHQLPSGLTTLERKYLWGPDIADGAAGGAGGLLIIRETKGNTTTDLIPLYDGTGHVIALTDLSKTLHAQYVYGPFGENIAATGPKANSNPWRWATKYLDEETGLYYFGKRYYDPITGQWLSREPLGERESLNLYSYCHNDPVNKVDVLGLAEYHISIPIEEKIALLAETICRQQAKADEIGPLNSGSQGRVRSALLLRIAAQKRELLILEGALEGGIKGEYGARDHIKQAAEIVNGDYIGRRTGLQVAIPWSGTGQEIAKGYTAGVADGSAKSINNAVRGVVWLGAKATELQYGSVISSPYSVSGAVETYWTTDYRPIQQYNLINFDIYTNSSYLGGTMIGAGTTEIAMFVGGGEITNLATKGLDKLSRLGRGVKTGAYTHGFDHWGKSLGKLEGKQIRVSERGINMVKTHLSNPYFDQTSANIAMIRRLEDAYASGSRISGADASFYLHELSEATIMSRMGGYVDEVYEAAHGASLLKYDVSPFSVYHPEVIQSDPFFNANWRAFWGIE